MSSQKNRILLVIGLGVASMAVSLAFAELSLLDPCSLMSIIAPPHVMSPNPCPAMSKIAPPHVAMLVVQVVVLGAIIFFTRQRPSDSRPD